MNMREKLLEHGMDDDWVATQYREFVNDAPPNAKLNALNRISDLLGHTKRKGREDTKYYYDIRWR